MDQWSDDAINSTVSLHIHLVLHLQQLGLQPVGVGLRIQEDHMTPDPMLYTALGLIAFACVRLYRRARRNAEKERS